MKIMKFEKQNCSPCQLVQNFLEDKGVDIERFDAFANPRLAGQYDIASVPTVVLEDEMGVEIKRSIGFKPEELQEMIGKKLLEEGGKS